MVVPLTPSSSNPATSMTIEPSDDLSFTVNIRWYWSDKYGIVGSTSIRLLTFWVGLEWIWWWINIPGPLTVISSDFPLMLYFP